MKAIHRIVIFGALLVLSIALFSAGSNSPAQAQSPNGIRGPFYGKAIQPSRFDGDVRTLPKAQFPSTARGLPVGAPPALGARAPSAFARPDSVRQNFPGGPRAPAPSLDFPGLRGGDPPDPNLDVGPNDIIESINKRFIIYDKAGNVRAGPFSIASLFSANGGTGTGCDSSGPSSDPVVLYDQQADRWIITILAWDNIYDGPYYECIAVSQTADPVSGGWYRYAFVTDNNFLSDYPKLGVWPDAYYMMADMFDIQRCGGANQPPCPQGKSRIETFEYVQVWAFDRGSMLSGGTLNSVSFTVNSNQFSFVPSNYKGTPPPAGRPNYFGAVDFSTVGFGATSDRVHIWRFALNGAWPTPPATFTGPTDVTVASFNAPTQDVPQPGTTVRLDTLGNRLLYQFQYRNIGGVESLWAVHTVDAGGGVNGMRWYQLNVTGNTIAAAPVQQGTFSPDTTHRWIGHLAADRFGNMALGYSVSSSTISPSLRYTGRLAGDPLGVLQAEATIVNGSGALTNCAAPCTARWGDYSSMEVDPVDDCTFWYVGEYVDATGNTTHIGSMRFPACAADVAVSKSGPATVIAGTDLTYNLTVTNNGPVGAQVVSWLDSLPAGTTFVRLTQNTGPTFDCNLPLVGSWGTVTCTANALANGASATFTLVVHVGPSVPDSSTLSNTASVTTTSSDPSSVNNSSTATTVVHTSADLSVSKTAVTDPVIAGTDETYHITVTNNGPSDAQNVSLSDAIPANTTFVSLAKDTGPAFTCTTPPVSAGVSCTLTTLPAGASATFTLVVHVLSSAPDGSTIVNTANVSTTTTDPNLANNSGAVTVGVITRADLSVSKTAVTDPVIAGTDETYHITVTNNGPSDAQSVSLSDAIPANTTFVSLAKDTGPAFTCTTPPVSAGVSCTLATLPAGASATFTLVVHVLSSAPDGSTIANTADVSATTIDPSLANNSSTVTVDVITRADLSVSKSQAKDLVIADIDQTYHFTLVNNGPSDAQNVTLSDPIPTNTIFVSLAQDSGPAFMCTTPAVGGTGNVTCTISTFAAGASASFTLVVRISPVDADSITNAVAVSSDTVDPDPANNAASVTAKVSIAEWKEGVLTDLIALRGSVTDKQVGQKLDQAIRRLSNSLDPSLWVSDNTLDPKRGNRVFSEEKDAVVFMTDLIKTQDGGLAGVLQGYVDRLIAADHALADIALHQAMAAGGAANHIGQATNELAQGDNNAGAGKFVVAIEHYRNAWQHSQQAMKK